MQLRKELVGSKLHSLAPESLQLVARLLGDEESALPSLLSGCKLSLGSQDRLDLTWTWTWSEKSSSRVFHDSQKKTISLFKNL